MSFKEYINEDVLVPYKSIVIGGSDDNGADEFDEMVEFENKKYKEFSHESWNVNSKEFLNFLNGAIKIVKKYKYVGLQTD